MNNNKYDFGGWATKYDISCSDGRTIKKNAFKHCDGIQIPLVWNHNYDGPDSIIGNVTLKHSDTGVYAYGKFNKTDSANVAKELVIHRDITALSIYANKLTQKSGSVLHGNIKEVSLVLAGANPGASIDEVLVHGEFDNTAATIYNNEEELEIFHSEYDSEDDSDKESESDKDSKTVAEVYESMTDDQKAVVAIIAEQMAEGNDNNDNNDNEEGDEDMKHNVFDQANNKTSDVIKHSEFLEETLADIKKHGGSLRESFIAHADSYGIENIDQLFPDPHTLQNEPEFISRDQAWVQEFFNGLKKSPFSRLKSMYADITADDARARGYTKGNLKIEEVFGLLKRTTSPTTVYKKQKLDRDDVIDITDFEVVAWLKREMRTMLDEEIARAVLIGDGRPAHSADKIKEANIRPIYNDEDLFTIKAAIGTPGEMGEAQEIIKTIIKSMALYEGVGTPNCYMDPNILSDMLLLTDKNGRFIYPDEATLAKTLRVKKIVPIQLLRGLKRDAKDNKTHDVLSIIVNPSDYTLGADKGGAVSMFDDFDIDYNQMKYLIEARCSGSLLKPKTAITIEKVTG